MQKVGGFAPPPFPAGDFVGATAVKIIKLNVADLWEGILIF